ncbi:MAG: TonB-dependent receptor [Myxococcota bacterium]
MTRRASRARVVAFVVLWLAGLAPAADGLAQYGAVATVEREIPATNTLDATAAGTEVKVADRIVAQTMNELLQRAAGTRVVQSGAQGEPFCLRLRGAPCDQTTVLFGDAPISNPDTGAFDLSLIPLEAVDGFQVFRGGAPTWISQGAIGGVLRLLPREVTHNVLGARVTAGSFGSWRANLYGGYAGDRFQFFGTGGAAGAKNDFPFRFDNGTVFDPTDDEERRRQNADFREGFGSSNMVVETSDKSQLRLVFLGVGRERGLPGAGARLALRARDQTTRLIGSASWTQEDDGEFPYRLQLLTSYDYGRNRVDDRFAEIGTGGGRLTDDRNNSIFARAASEVEVQRWLELTAIASARYFFRNPDDELASMPERDSDRLTLSGTIEANFNGRIGDVLFELRPSVLLSWTRTFVTFIDLGNERENQSSDFLPTYRVGGAVAPLEWLSLRGSVSSGFRLPNTLQLFGNRSTILANPELRPEKSLAYDAGITLRGHRELLSGYLAVGYFLSNVDNQIRFRRTSQFTLIAENIEGARNQGVEAEVRGGISPHFLITGELTWTQARDDSTGNQLPGQPELVAFVSPEGHTLDLSERVSDLLVFVEVNHIGRSFADPANLVVIGARTTFAVGIGALFFDGALGLGFRADDLFDVRGQDLLGFPLPGRRYSGRVTYERSW